MTRCMMFWIAAIVSVLSARTCWSGSTVLYVDASARSGGNGASWPSAFQSLQTALAASADPDVVQIWVADGTYRPDNGTLERGAVVLGKEWRPDD